MVNFYARVRTLWLTVILCAPVAAAFGGGETCASSVRWSRRGIADLTELCALPYQARMVIIGGTADIARAFVHDARLAELVIVGECAPWCADIAAERQSGDAYVKINSCPCYALYRSGSHGAMSAVFHALRWGGPDRTDVQIGLARDEVPLVSVACQNVRDMFQLPASWTLRHYDIAFGGQFLSKDRAAQMSGMRKLQGRPASHIRVRTICDSFRSVARLDAQPNVVLLMPGDGARRAELFVRELEKLPEGVQILSTIELNGAFALEHEDTTTVAATSLCDVAIYRYRVQRPTIETLLDDVYKKFHISGFGVEDSEDLAQVRNAGGDPTYGEIEPDSQRTIFTKLVPLSANDVFYDLGCGVGKLVQWVYFATPVKKAAGIELSRARCTMAHKAKGAVAEAMVGRAGLITGLTQCAGDACRTLDIRHGDITKANLDDATVIFICATCFSSELMQKLTDKFATLKDGLRIVTLKQLTEHPALQLVHSERLPMSWSRGSGGSMVYIYEKHAPRA